MNPTGVVLLVTAIVGALLGTAGFVISILAFLRDRPKLKVTLQWDFVEMGGDPNEKMGFVRVANVGRRPAFLSIVSLELPKGYRNTHEVLLESVPGKPLPEGGAPASFRIRYEGLVQYKKDWAQIRAVAEDTSGKSWFSKHSKKMPSWAK
jgi:hypothetical protein